MLATVHQPPAGVTAADSFNLPAVDPVSPRPARNYGRLSHPIAAGHSALANPAGGRRYQSLALWRQVCAGEQGTFRDVCYHLLMSAAQTFSEASRKLGIVSALGVALLCPVYAVTLVGGLLSLRAPLDPIGDPFFSILEILIMLLAPLMVVLTAVIHAWAPEKVKVFGLISLVFMSLLAVVTCGVHFVILTVSRDASVATLTWAPLFLSFKWPSVVYALDILAWDILFALSAFFAACVFDGSRLAKWIRGLLWSSGALAFLGLAGVAFGDMQLRNIGILGYVGVFPIAALLLAILFIRAKSSESE